MLDEVPELGYKFTGTATSGGATLTTTDPEINKLGSLATAKRWEGWFLYIPTGTANTDDIHSVTTQSVSAATCTITTLGNYGATYTAVAMYLLKKHPTQLKRLANDALEYLFVDCFIPLGHGPDDPIMADTGASSWTGTGTIAKQPTAGEVLYGPQSISLTDGGGGGQYVQSTLMNIGQGATVTFHGILKADTGTGTYQFLDNSSNVQDSVLTTQEDWVYITKQVPFDAADEGARARIVGTTASAQVDLQAAWMVKQGSPQFRLPSWLDGRFKFKGLAYGVYHIAGREAQTWMADSVEFTRVDPQFYRYIARQADANPFALELLNTNIWPCSPYTTPLFMVVSCPFSAPYGVATIFVADTTSTGCDQHLLTAQWKYLLGKSWPAEFPTAKSEGLDELKERQRERERATRGTVEFRG